MEDFTATKKTAAAGRRRAGRTVYTLKDYGGEDVRGTWYPEELQPIGHNEYKVERVLKRRRADDGSQELFVKWLGWPEKFNSWIKDSDYVS